MASTYLYRTSGTSTDAQKFTMSFWLKRSSVGSAVNMLYYSGTGGTANADVDFTAADELSVYERDASSSSWQLKTTRVFKDTGAWYHICITGDSTIAETDRVKIYINGVRETSFSTETYPVGDWTFEMNKSSEVRHIGKYVPAAPYYYDGSMSHFHFIDGTAYQASTFGETDSTSGIWKIITSPSVTYGNNGFFLTMEDRTNLDLDSSPNAHTFTTSGTLTATYDNPSNNFATWNPLFRPTSNLPTFANGNTTAVHATTSGGWRTIESTLAVSAGKWYWECIGGNSSGHIYNGVCSLEWLIEGDPASMGPSGEMGYLIAQPSYGIYALNGALAYSNTSGYGTTVDAYTSSYDNTDYTSVYLDLDNNKIYWSINGTIQNSGTGYDIQTGFTYMPCISIYNTAAAGADANFGNGTFASTALTGTTYSDNDSIGTFKYSPNYGGAATFDSAAKNFMALCTKNIKAYGG